MRRRLTRKIKNKRKKQIVIIFTICLLLVMGSGYAAFSTNLSITAKGNIKEKTRVIQYWDYNFSTDFHSDFYKENIVSVTFLDNNNVSSNATESWNVSKDKENGGVMAWVVPNNEDNTKYDLYIGAKGGVIANEDSSWLFANFENLESINFNNNFDTSNVKTMVGMFTSWNVDTSDWTPSSLKNINFGETFDTSNVVKMNDMFSGTQFTELDLSNFNTSSLTSMYHMFNNCSNLTTLNLCSFNNSKITYVDGVFQLTPNLIQVKEGPLWAIDKFDNNIMFYQSNISSVTTGKC